METTKTCKKCNTEKNLNQFDKQKDCKLGVKNYCKECYKLINKERYDKKRDDIIRQNRQYQYAHPEKYQEYQKTYYQNKKSKVGSNVLQ